MANTFRNATYEEALRAHDRVLEDSGGEPGLLSEGGLRAALAIPDMVVFDYERYPTPIEKIGALMFEIISIHPFLDGNKRTALSLVSALMRLNGYILVASDGEKERICVLVAMGHIYDRDLVIDWLKEHHVVIEGP